MKLLEFLALDKLSVKEIVAILKMAGFNVGKSEEKIALLTALLDGIISSGKYQTLGDVLADEELIAELKSLGEKDSDSEEEIVSIKKETVLVCPHCGKAVSFKHYIERK